MAPPGGRDQVGDPGTSNMATSGVDHRATVWRNHHLSRRLPRPPEGAVLPDAEWDRVEHRSRGAHILSTRRRQQTGFIQHQTW